MDAVQCYNKYNSPWTLCPCWRPFPHGIRLSCGSLEFFFFCVPSYISGFHHSWWVLGNRVRTHVNSKGKIPSTEGSEQDWTCDAASCRTASPTHYQLSYSSPHLGVLGKFLPVITAMTAPTAISTGENGSLVATLLGAWRYMISASNGWPVVSIINKWNSKFDLQPQSLSWSAWSSLYHVSPWDILCILLGHRAI